METNEPYKLKPPLAKTARNSGTIRLRPNLQMAYLSSQDVHLHACIDVTLDMPEMQPNPQNDTWLKFQLRIIAQF